MMVFAGRAARSWTKLRHRKFAASTTSLRSCRAGRKKASSGVSRQRRFAKVMKGGARSYARNSPPAENEQDKLLRCRNLCLLHRNQDHSNIHYQRRVVHQDNRRSRRKRLASNPVCGCRQIFPRTRRSRAPRAARSSKRSPTRTPSVSCFTQALRCSSSASSSGCATFST